MSANEISKITVYKLRIGEFQDVTLSNFDLVAEGTALVEQTGCSYRLYFLKQYSKEASWYGVFRDLPLNIGEDHIPKTLTSGFVLLVQQNASSFYGVVGGVGHIYLKKACKIEPRFGITLAEVILSLPELKGLVQKDTSGEINYLNRAFRGVYNPHGDVNNLKRVLTHVRGSLVQENEFHDVIGRSIQASDALSVNGTKSFSDILTFLARVNSLWEAGEKKISIPQLEHINKKFDAILLEQLEAKLTQMLCNYSDETINLFLDNEEVGYLPDRVIEYNLIYARRRHSAESYEGVFESVREILQIIEGAERMNAFRKMSLELRFDDDTTERRELAYFICGDIEHNNNVYFINNKRWYRASENYISKLDSELDNIEYINSEELELIEWDEQKFTGRQAEQQYNAANSCFVMMDCRLVNIANERGGIEFCDLLKNTTGEVLLVHVKHACGAALRALFAQGFVSAKLYAESNEFRDKIHSGHLKGADASFQETATPILKTLVKAHKREIKVIFAIFDNKESHKVPSDVSETSEYLRGTLTTFAKVDLLERVNAIRGMGYGVAITRIEPYPHAEG